jgi:hypothetical protein
MWKWLQRTITRRNFASEKKNTFFLRRNAETNECTPPISHGTTHKQSGKTDSTDKHLKRGQTPRSLEASQDPLPLISGRRNELKGGFENLSPPRPLRLPLISETDSRKGEAARGQELPQKNGAG